MPKDSLFSIEGNTIVLTGGYGQIGRSIGAEILARDANLCILEPNPRPELDQSAYGDDANSSRFLSLKADVTDKPSLEEARASIVEHFGAIDGLINNAALDSPPDSDARETGPFEDYPISSWDKVMDVNVKGVFQCCQVFGGAMAENGGGSIINVASIYGTVSPDQGLYQYRRDRGEVFYKPVAYSASKSALYNLTRYIAVYWGKKNVRANSVTFAGVFNDQDEQFLAEYKRKIPLRRCDADEARGGMALPEDFAGSMIFLLSPGAAYVTGADLRVDGGFLAL